MNIFNENTKTKNEKLNFLDYYWEIVGPDFDFSNISKNQHFNPLNTFLLNEIKCAGIIEDKIPTKYCRTKKWDMHFPEKKVAIEYKSLPCRHAKNLNNRLEEAIGCGIDLKANDPEYKLGYIMIFPIPAVTEFNYTKLIEMFVESFEKMVDDKIYDFFCPIKTFGKGLHEEVSEKYNLDTFIKGIQSK